MKIVSEESPYCGQTARVVRVFWRGRAPWVLARLRAGGVTAVAWVGTDLPVPEIEPAPSPDDRLTALLSPAALRDLVRFLGDRRNSTK